MKRLVFGIVLVASVVMAQTAPPQNPPAAPDKSLAAAAAKDPNTQKARALIDKMIAAMGGQAFLSYTTYTQEGRSYSFWQGQPSSTGVLFWRFVKLPDKERIELTKQRDVISIFNGDAGYEITFKGTAAVEKKDLLEYLRRRQHSVEQVVRTWIPDPATLVFYDGTAVVDQNLVEQVTLVNKQNDSVTLSIDPNTGMLIKKSFTYRNPTDNLKDTDEEVFANYRPVQGIMTPFSTVRFHNGLQTNQRFVTKVEYNVPIDDSKFDAKATYEPYKLSPKR